MNINIDSMLPCARFDSRIIAAGFMKQRKILAQLVGYKVIYFSSAVLSLVGCIFEGLLAQMKLKSI